TILQLIKRAEEDKRIKGVLFEINSPGGSPVATEEIVRAIEKLKRKKPAVAWIADVGASGAYWIASSCNKTYADALSITGSIGVYSASTDLSRLYDWLGINITIIKSGKYKDMGSSSRGLTDEEKKENFLWKIEKADKVWYIHHIDVPEISLVIGNTGLKGDTKSEVNKVYRFYEKSAFAKDVIKEIGQLTLEGAHALKKKDIVKIGELMDRNQKLLTILGVSTSELEKLINASKPYSYGAKLTGAGGGGCMLALTDKPDIVAKKIREKGGEPYIVKIETKGTHLVSK
ncbi:MAG TPA: hypothetical protein EYP29_05865, partial [Thermoplasmata archaeon]|nr:hypothetical protein [Thermoplasmata archaeon]